MSKSPEMKATLEAIGIGLFGRSPSTCRKKGICISCEEPAHLFTDELSRREYELSTLCQSCQDNMFGDPDDDEEYGDEWGEDDGQPDEAQEWYDYDPDC